LTSNHSALRSAAPLIAMLISSTAVADEAFDACLRTSAAEETRCGEEWIAREQARLDAAWQQLVAVADGDVATALTAEQRAWEAFRDTSCTFKLDEGFGGAGGPTGYHACRAEAIADRAAAVEGYTKYIDN
jgi:uncharacterized protein YecT (DUF1311 family)